MAPRKSVEGGWYAGLSRGSPQEILRRTFFVFFVTGAVILSAKKRGENTAQVIQSTKKTGVYYLSLVSIPVVSMLVFANFFACP